MKKFSRRAAKRPAEILEAALSQFYAAGFSATKIEQIAAAAGVTAGTIYRYFPSKESLFQAVVEAHLDSSWSRGREIAEAYGSMTAREVIALLLARWTAVLGEPGPRRVAILVIREAPLFPASAALYESELLSKGRLAIERALRHGIDRGEFPLLPIESTARALLGSVLERVIWLETFGADAESAEEDGEEIDLLVRGIPRLDSPPSATPRVDRPPAPVASSEVPVHAPGLRITTLRRPGSH